MSTTYSQIPMATCPHCGKEFQWDDYYEIKAGDSRECPHCEREVWVRRVDMHIDAVLGTSEHYDDVADGVF